MSIAFRSPARRRLFLAALLLLVPALAQAQVAAHLALAYRTWESQRAATGVAVDSGGSLYTLDAASKTLLRVGFQAGVYSTTVVSDSSLNLTAPVAVATDASGNLYLLDQGNTSGFWKGTPQGSSFAWNLVRTSTLNQPASLRVGPGGSVYLADTGNNRVLKETPATGGYAESVVSDPTAPTALAGPQGVAVDGAGNVFIADTGHARVLLEKQISGGYAETVVAAGTVPGTGLPGGTHVPFGVAVSDGGTLFVTCRNDGLVLQETPSTGAWSETTLISGLGGAPQELVVDGRDHLFLSGGTGVMELSARAEFPALPVGPAGSPASLTDTFLLFSFDSAGTLGNVAVVTQGLAGADFVATPAGTLVANHAYAQGDQATLAVAFAPHWPGASHGGVTLTDAGGTLAATALLQGRGTGPQVAFQPGAWAQANIAVSAPSALAVDAFGDLVFADAGVGQVEQGTLLGGGYVPGSVATGLGSPAGVALDGSGAIYLADTGNNQVLKEVPGAAPGAGGAGGGLPGPGGPGGGTSYSAITVATGLASPAGVAVDDRGNVYIADTGHNQVLKETFAAGGYTPTPVGSGLAAPQGVAVDADGNVYIADTGNGRVLKETLAGGSYTQSQLGSGLLQPAGVAVDGLGNVYIADAGLKAVLAETLAGGTYSQATLPSGWDSAGVPVAVAVDGAGNLFVADSGHNVIWRLDVATPPALDFGTVAVGSSARQTVTILNNGNQDLVLPAPPTDSNPALAGEFAWDATLNPFALILPGGQAQALAAGGRWTFTVGFDPLSAGAKQGSLVLADTGLSAPQSVSLAGTASQGAATVTLPAPGTAPTAFEPASFTATVAGGGATPTGTVTFTVDGVQAGQPVTLAAGGTATFTTSSLTAGFHDIVATYGGDANYLGQVAAILPGQAVVKQDPAVVLAASPASAAQGALVTLTATITGAGAIPGGPVTFMDGTTQLGTVYPSNGIATWPASKLAGGSHSITAVYGGDANFQAHTSPAQTVTIAQKVDSLGMYWGGHPAVGQLGVMDTFNVEVGGNFGTPTGTLSFTVDGQPGPVVALAAGTNSGVSVAVATLSTSFPTAGAHTILAHYSGDATYLGTDSTFALTVAKATATVAFPEAGGTADRSDPFNLVVTVTGPVLPTGLVSFKVDGTPFGAPAPVSLGSGQTIPYAWLSTDAIPQGAHVITATYLGDGNYQPADSSGSMPLTIVAAQPTVTLASSGASAVNQPVTFTATVKGGSVTPTGKVRFAWGPGGFQDVDLDGQGQAVLSKSDLPAGRPDVKVTYLGDPVYTNETAELIQVVSDTDVAVTQPPPSTIILDLGSNSSGTATAISLIQDVGSNPAPDLRGELMDVPPGVSFTLNIEDTPSSSYATSGAPDRVPATSALGYPVAANFASPRVRKLTLTFSRAPGNSSHLLVTRGLRPATGAGAGALLCCAIFALPGARRRKRLGTFLGLLVLVLAGLGTACRDSSGGSAGATSGVVQPGTYPVTVIVKSGPVVEATMKFNLEVR